MRMHIGRKVTAFGLAAIVVGGAAGTALAASGGSSTAQASAAPATAVKTAAATQPDLGKMTMTELTAKLGVSQARMVKALDDVKGTLMTSGKLSQDGVDTLVAKVLARDLGISGASATWAAEEIDGGYVPTYVDWGFGTASAKK